MDDPERLHQALARFAQRRLRPALPDEPRRSEPELEELEAEFVEEERAAVAAAAKGAPVDPDGFVAWFESLRESGPQLLSCQLDFALSSPGGAFTIGTGGKRSSRDAALHASQIGRAKRRHSRRNLKVPIDSGGCATPRACVQQPGRCLLAHGRYWASSRGAAEGHRPQ